ncbi:MAG: DUF2510 domain-containing protein [Ktedonobacteraceae bacterium]
MPLFRKPSEPGLGDRRVLTVNGRPQPQPEIICSMPRRFRLFIECARRLAADPLAAPAAGRPIGDGCGLERLVARVAALFEREQSLIRWVALRGAFADLFIRIFDPDSAVASPEDLEQVMGLAWVTDVQGESHPDLVLTWRTTLSPDQRQAALGVASSVFIRTEDYGRYPGMSVIDVNADPGYRIPKSAALDCIVWSAVALLRLEIAQQIFPQVPEPDALSEPGWYTDPLFAKSERFWDGSDWTARCRRKDGHRFIGTNVLPA